MNPVFNFGSTPSPGAVRPARQDDCRRIAELAEQLGYQCTPEQVEGRLNDMQDLNQYAVPASHTRWAAVISDEMHTTIRGGAHGNPTPLVVRFGFQAAGVSRICL